MGLHEPRDCERLADLGGGARTSATWLATRARERGGVLVRDRSLDLLRERVRDRVCFLARGRTGEYRFGLSFERSLDRVRFDLSLDFVRSLDLLRRDLLRDRCLDLLRERPLDALLERFRGGLAGERFDPRLLRVFDGVRERPRDLAYDGERERV